MKEFSDSLINTRITNYSHFEKKLFTKIFTIFWKVPHIKNDMVTFIDGPWSLQNDDVCEMDSKSLVVDALVDTNNNDFCILIVNDDLSITFALPKG